MAYATYSSHQQHAYYGAQPYDHEDFSDNYGSQHYSNKLQSYPQVSEHNYYDEECVKPAAKLQQVQFPCNANGYGRTNNNQQQQQHGMMSPFSAGMLPSAFPKGTNPEIVKCFQMVDQDRSGFIDDKELQRALSSVQQSFSLRTIHLLMHLHTNNPKVRQLGPREFIAVYQCLQSWRTTFQRFDTDRSGKIDSSELQRALGALGFRVSPAIMNLLIAKYDKTGYKKKGLEYDSFIECCLTVKGLSDKFKENDVSCTGTVTFTYEEFMTTVLPFLMI
ncbi:hypothetical protein C5167_012937 [Papaver somniferum]|uniref:EF-hand domain-containing protein n=1 Tax=Papaver somniferum TaxID=3469 RepID=A0A4Y7IYX8_PAPSO|nr:probable calcium-binding protein CML49 [Papaver somniferum]RZC54084.1 hypothetical protein C5167_012937 [Papaver somniferum]